MGQAELKLAQFADDMTVMLSEEDSLPELMRVLKEFESWSGLKINKKKTKIVSPEKVKAGVTSTEGIEICARVKILGIWIGLNNTEENCYKWNYENILTKIRKVCDAWYQRSLSIKGKITIINSLLVSLLQYPCSIIHTPERVYKEYKQIVTSFIWDSRKPRIAYKTLTLPIENGGLKLIDLEARVTVNLLQWIRRVLTKPDTNIADSLRLLLETNDLTRFFSFRSPVIPTNLVTHRFYYKMMKVYHAAHDVDPTDENSIRNQILWFNRSIGVKNNTIHWPRWEKAGINTIGDICHLSEGRLMSHQEIRTKFGVSCTFLEALTIRLHIPSQWRNSLTDNWQPLVQRDPHTSITLGEQRPKDITVLSAKQMYKSLTAQSQTNCAAFNKWTKGIEDVQVNNSTEWQEICERNFSSTRETKLQSLQFKVLHRVVPCGVHLKHLRIRETDECPSCKQRDSVVHFFFHCHLVQSFWRQVCAWFKSSVELYLDQLTPKEVMFGLPRQCHKSGVINFILMQVRFFIYRQKLFHDCDLNFMQWLREFKYKLDMEKWICTRMNTPTRFDKWIVIREELD